MYSFGAKKRASCTILAALRVNGNTAQERRHIIFYILKRIKSRRSIELCRLLCRLALFSPARSTYVQLRGKKRASCTILAALRADGNTAQERRHIIFYILKRIKSRRSIELCRLLCRLALFSPARSTYVQLRGKEKGLLHHSCRPECRTASLL